MFFSTHALCPPAWALAGGSVLAGRGECECGASLGPAVWRGYRESLPLLALSLTQGLVPRAGPEGKWFRALPRSSAVLAASQK